MKTKHKLLLLLVFTVVMLSCLCATVSAASINSFTIKVGDKTFTADTSSLSGGTGAVEVNGTSTKFPLAFSASASGTSTVTIEVSGNDVSESGAKSVSGTISSAGTLTFKATMPGVSAVTFTVNVTQTNYADAAYKWTSYSPVHVYNLKDADKKSIWPGTEGGTDDMDVRYLVSGATTGTEADVLAVIKAHDSDGKNYGGYTGKTYHMDFYRDHVLYESAKGPLEPFETLYNPYNDKARERFIQKMASYGYSLDSRTSVEGNWRGTITYTVDAPIKVTVNWFMEGATTPYKTIRAFDDPKLVGASSNHFKPSSSVSLSHSYKYDGNDNGYKCVKTTVNGKEGTVGSYSATYSAKTGEVTVNHYMQSPIKLTVKVVGREGEKLEGAGATCTTGGLETLSGTSKTYNIPKPSSGSVTYEFKATASKHIYNTGSVKIEPTSKDQTLTIILTKKGTITVNVVDEKGKALEPDTITAKPASAKDYNETGTVELKSSMMPGTVSYRMENLYVSKNGDVYDFTAEKKGYTKAVGSCNISYDDNNKTVKLVLVKEPEPKDYTLTVNVVDTARKALTVDTLTATKDGGTKYTASSVSSKTFTTASDKIGAGTYSASASKAPDDKGAWKVKSVTPESVALNESNTTGTITIVMEREALPEKKYSIAVTVVDTDDKPLTADTVSVTKAGGSEYTVSNTSSATFTTDSNGIGAGTYTATASKNSDGKFTWSVKSVTPASVVLDNKVLTGNIKIVMEKKAVPADKKYSITVNVVDTSSKPLTADTITVSKVGGGDLIAANASTQFESAALSYRTTDRRSGAAVFIFITDDSLRLISFLPLRSHQRTACR